MIKISFTHEGAEILRQFAIEIANASENLITMCAELKRKVVSFESLGDDTNAIIEQIELISKKVINHQDTLDKLAAMMRDKADEIDENASTFSLKYTR